MQYSIYIPSKGRPNSCKTAELCQSEGIPFRVVIEPQDKLAYEKVFGSNILVLPKDNQGLTSSRTFIKRYSESRGELKHWQIDDDIGKLYKFDWEVRKSYECKPLEAFNALEAFVEQYKNIGAASLRCHVYRPEIPVQVNKMIYTCMLISNALDIYWVKTPAYEDVDYSIQVLTAGWCTILFNRYLFPHQQSSSRPGGRSENTIEKEADVNLKGISILKRRWPRLITKTVRSRRGFPIPYTAQVWRKFKTKLIRA